MARKPAAPDPVPAAADRARSKPKQPPRQEGLLEAVVHRSTPQPGQVVLGTLRELHAQGLVSVHVPALGDLPPASSLVPLGPEHLGRTVALSLLDAGRALVLGVLWDGEPANSQQERPSAAHDLRVDGQQHVIEAQESVELRCGEAAIILTADGRIQLRGTYITSQADATQRILGGSVHVN